jgi:hypothetical protein
MTSNFPATPCFQLHARHFAVFSACDIFPLAYSKSRKSVERATEDLAYDIAERFGGIQHVGIFAMKATIIDLMGRCASE